MKGMLDMLRFKLYRRNRKIDLKLKKIIALSVLLTFILGCVQSTKQDKKEINITKIKSLADSCYEKNNYEQARIYLDELIQADSSNGELFYKRGYSYAQLTNFEKSSMDYLKAVSLGFRVSDAYYNLGINQIPSLNDSLAIYYLEESLKLSPNAPETISTLEACKKRLNSQVKDKKYTI